MKENSNKTSWMQENKFVIVNILLTNIWWVSFPIAFLCKDKKWLLLGLIAFSINLVNIVHEIGKDNKEGF